MEHVNPTNDISHHSREKLSLFMIPQIHTEYNYALISEKIGIGHVCAGGNSSIPEPIHQG